MIDSTKPTEEKNNKEEKYPKEQLWKIYRSLPKDLQEAMFSQETSESINSVCKKNGLEKEMPEIAELIGYTFLGLLPPEEFQEFLEKKLEIEKNVAISVYREINRFVFSPVKISLDQLYEENKKSNIPTEKETVIEENLEKTKTEDRPSDKYQEPIQ
jgi:hypothetical protein